MFVNLLDNEGGEFRVCVAMSGKHWLRGKFDTLAEATAFQANLFEQKWSYVPIYRKGEREPFVNLA